jgi:hypothetical protein
MEFDEFVHAEHEGVDLFELAGHAAGLFGVHGRAESGGLVLAGSDGARRRQGRSVPNPAVISVARAT